MPSCGELSYDKILAAPVRCRTCGVGQGDRCILTRSEQRYTYDPSRFVRHG